MTSDNTPECAHQSVSMQQLGQIIPLGPPLVLDVDTPVKIIEGRSDVFLRGEFGQVFIAEMTEGHILWPQISPPSTFILVPSVPLKLAALDDANRHAGAGFEQWKLAGVASLNKALSEYHNLTDELTNTESPLAFNNRLLEVHGQHRLEQEAGELARLQRSSSTDSNSVEEMLAAATQSLGISSTAAANTSVSDEFSKLHSVVHAYGLRSRTLSLDADWMINEQGPLLLQQRNSEAIFCAIWNGRHYEHHDGKSISDEQLNEFRSTAIALFAPLDSEITGLWSLARYVLKGNSHEFKRAAIAASFVALLGAMVPLATGWILSDIAPSGELGMLVGVGAALCLAAFVNYVLATVRAIAVSRIQGRTDYRLNAALYDRLLNLPTGFFKDYTAGDLNQRLANVNAIKSLILETGLSAGLSVVLSVFYLGILLYYDVRMAMISLVLVAIYILLIAIARVLQKPYLTRAFALDGELTERSYEMISAVAKLRTAAAEERALSRWRSLYAEERELEQSIGRIGGLFGAISDGWQAFTLVILFAMAGWLSTLDLSPGFFIAYLAAFGAFQGAFVSLSSQAIAIYAAQPQLERAIPILTAKTELLVGRADAGKLEGDIEMRSVTFAYNQGQAPIINDLSVKINRGQHFAVVGASGSGKSTLLRLLLGFETPQSGAIYYDQQDMAQLDAASVRKQTGVVLQSSSLYAGSIIENIRGSSDATLEDCLHAAEMAGLDADLKQLPMGIHTPLTEGAAALSGGQRQRILIARAFVNKPKIMFFDEATSALDNATQATVAAALDALPVTRITIAHRLSTVRHADCICVLEDGRFIEQGSYEDLMAKNGAFAKLAKRQLIEHQDGE